ncbi:GON-4-like protein, partial [Caerostris darwini]
MACNDDKSNVSDDIDETDWMFKRIKRKNAEISHSDNNKKFKLSNNETNVNSEINCGKVVENINEGTNRQNTKSRCRSKLTAENVKTILRYALANDSILAMVQNMMKAHNANLPQPSIKIQSETARSEKKKKLRRPILTSTKKTNEISKNLFDEEYSEESASDEDYQPNEDELSDEDVTSSIKANHVNSTVSNNSTCQDSKVEDPLSDNEDALVIALPKVFNCHDLQGVSKIAERTRSKLPLNDTPLETIEASFVPPDITKDMYDTKCVDDEWQKFLCELTKPLEPTCEIDGEDDPEYKVREEELACEPDLEEDEDFGEDSTPELNDELNVLMKEILESDQEQIFLKQDFSFLEEYNLVGSEEEKKLNNSEHTELAPSCKDTPPPTEKHQTPPPTEKHQTPPPKEKLQTPPPVFETFPIKEEVREEWMILDERLQLDEQMRMHVQLATQSYLLSHGNPKLNFMCETAKTYLNELKIFSSGPVANNQQSAFYAHNLDGALDIIKKFDLKTEEDINTEKSHEYKITSLRTIPKHVRKTLATSKVFIYPELLPEHGFREILFSCYKALFCTAEDNLIAIGLEEFSYADDPVEFVRHYLLPMKKKHQIINHINLCKKEDPSKNAIAFYYKYRKPIEFKRVIRIFNPDNVKSPEEYPPENLPEWMKKYSKLAMPKKLKKELIPEKKVQFILPLIPVKLEIAKQFHVPQRPLATLCPLKIEPPCEKVKQEIILPKWRTRKKKLNICDKFTQLSSPPSVTPCAIPSDKDINDQNNLVPSSETNNHLDSQETVSKQKRQKDPTKSRKKPGNPKISKRNQS